MVCTIYLALATSAWAVVEAAIHSRDSLVPAPVVDLGYSQYEGYYNTTLDINVYRG